MDYLPFASLNDSLLLLTVVITALPLACLCLSLRACPRSRTGAASGPCTSKHRLQLVTHLDGLQSSSSSSPLREARLTLHRADLASRGHAEEKRTRVLAVVQVMALLLAAAESALALSFLLCLLRGSSLTASSAGTCPDLTRPLQAHLSRSRAADFLPTFSASTTSNTTCDQAREDLPLPLSYEECVSLLPLLLHHLLPPLLTADTMLCLLYMSRRTFLLQLLVTAIVLFISTSATPTSSPNLPGSTHFLQLSLYLLRSVLCLTCSLLSYTYHYHHYHLKHRHHNNCPPLPHPELAPTSKQSAHSSQWSEQLLSPVTAAHNTLDIEEALRQLNLGQPNMNRQSVCGQGRQSVSWLRQVQQMDLIAVANGPPPKLPLKPHPKPVPGPTLHTSLSASSSPPSSSMYLSSPWRKAPPQPAWSKTATPHPLPYPHLPNQPCLLSAATAALSLREAQVVKPPLISMDCHAFHSPATFNSLCTNSPALFHNLQSQPNLFHNANYHTSAPFHNRDHHSNRLATDLCRNVHWPTSPTPIHNVCSHAPVLFHNQSNLPAQSHNHPNHSLPVFS